MPDPDGAAGRGGTVYRAGRHARDDDAAEPRSAVPGRADSTYGGGRARAVWRPTRGVRRAPGEDPRSADPGYGAPQRGWRTADGGYRTADGRWRAPYVPYDTGEWRRDERPDTGPAGTGELSRYSPGTGEIARYAASGTGEIPPYQEGTGEVTRYSGGPPERPPYPDKTGEITRYRGGTGELARYSADADDLGRYPTASDERPRIPQRPASSPGYGRSVPRQRASGADRRGPAARNQPGDSPERYTYDPLTLGGGTSPAMRYDPATETFDYDPPAGGTPLGPGGGMPPGPGPDQRRDLPGAVGRRGPDRPPRPPAWQRPAAPPDVPPPAQRTSTRQYEPSGRFAGTYPARTRRPANLVPPPQGRAVPVVEDDEEADDAPRLLNTALVTTAWYTIPLLLYTMYVLTLDGSAQAGDGQSPREDALNGLLGGMPRVGVALVTSLVIAVLIRLISRGWRTATIGFASAVVGGGVATVIFTALQA